MLLTTAYWMFTCITQEGSIPSCSARDRLDKGSTLQTTLVQGGTIKDLEESTTKFVEPPPEPEPDIEDEDIKYVSRRLREADSANLEEYGDVGLNFQNRSAHGYDAPKKFVGTVNPKLLNRSTFGTFLSMTESFKTKSGVEKRVSPREMQRKVDAFLNAVFETNLWEILHNFLKESGVKQAKNVTMFRDYVKQIWFDQYPHLNASGVSNTSGFEQVFVGEIRRKDKQRGLVNGVQNWVRFHQLEKEDKDFDYKGYIDRRQNILATLQFSWLEAKGETSMFIGTSPEYDMAVYTLCFIARLENRCQIEMDGCSPEITVYGKDKDDKIYVSHLTLSLGKATSTCTREY